MEREADVVVIGAGISGCATAYNLARRGQKVVVLEKDDVAFEASGRTFAAVGLMGKHEPDEFRLAEASVEMWKHLDEELGTDVELIKGGRLAIANAEEDLPLFQEMVEGAERSGAVIEWMEPDQARRNWPFLEGPFIKAAMSWDEGHVNPEKAVHAFARSAQEYGAKIYTGCLAQDIGVSAGRVTSVTTTLGEIKTGAEVNVAGVWASRLLDRVGVHIPIQLVRITQGETEPVPRFFDCFIRGPAYVGRQTASGPLRVNGGYRKLDVLH
ncbi:MAG: FAD-dependent oxidoreductase, partial [Dehalococcoidia bacterium]